MPLGKSCLMSRSTPQARAAGPTSPSASHVSRVIVPVCSKRAWTDAALHSSASASSTSFKAASNRCCSSATRGLPTSNPTPPGLINPRPKRLPHSAAVKLRKSPRMRPQYAAVGRYPTSPASAPRSPVWFARRSSSSATPRSTCPGWNRSTAQGFDCFTIRSRMSYRGITA